MFAIVSQVEDYSKVIEELDKNGSISEKMRKELAVKSFQITCEYDTAISTYLSKNI